MCSLKILATTNEQCWANYCTTNNEITLVKITLKSNEITVVVTRVVQSRIMQYSRIILE